MGTRSQPVQHRWGPVGGHDVGAQSRRGKAETSRTSGDVEEPFSGPQVDQAQCFGGESGLAGRHELVVAGLAMASHASIGAKST